MSAFKEILLPESISFGAVGGPGFLTNIVSTNSGIEQRNQIWANEKGEWVISYDARRAQDFAELPAFFRIVRGRVYGFRFKDWNDYECLITDGVFAAVGTSTTIFQLYKKYTFGDEVYYRKIQKPALSQVLLYKNGTQLTYGIGAGQVVFDESKGLVTFNTAPGGATLSWKGPFHVPVRFGTDQMRQEIINKEQSGNLIKGWKDIAIREIRV